MEKVHYPNKVCDSCYNCCDMCCAGITIVRVQLEVNAEITTSLAFCARDCLNRWVERQKRMRTGNEHRLTFQST